MRTRTDPSNPLSHVSRPSGFLRRSRQAGFSLLEVLVAFAVLALILGVLLQVFSGSARRATLAESYLKASILADAKLNELGAEIPLVPGALTGEPEGGFDWSLHVDPFPVELLGDGAPNTLSLRVTVLVGWQEGGRRHEISAATLRLASAAP